MDNVQKHVTCNNIPSSQTFKSYLYLNALYITNNWRFLYILEHQHQNSILNWMQLQNIYAHNCIEANILKEELISHVPHLWQIYVMLYRLLWEVQCKYFTLTFFHLILNFIKIMDCWLFTQCLTHASMFKIFGISEDASNQSQPSPLIPK
jgi:thiaminase